jgi:transcription termination factor Rho
MSILDRAALEASPLADLHAIASELSIDGYRRLRREELIDAILSRQGAGEGGSGQDAAQPAAAAAEPDAYAERPFDASEQPPDEHEQPRDESEQPPRASVQPMDELEQPPDELAVAVVDEPPVEGDERPGGRQQIVEGMVELLPNGSGFVRVDPPEPSEDDVYVSAAQVKRCELISGDRISGPRRAPRRSERFASLARVDTINGRPAAEVVDATRFDDLPAAFPSERFGLTSDDPTVKTIEELTPFGHGSRVTIVGPPQAGKTEALRRLVTVLAEHDDVQLSVVLSGIRPEEIPEWTSSQVEPMAALSFAVSPDSRAQAVEGAVDRGRRLAARGSDAVVVIDTLEGLHPAAARKALAAARNIVDGGSLTVIATAAGPVGGETTVIALDPLLAGTHQFPAISLRASWTMRPELLVGEDGADAIAKARAQAADS